MPGPRVVNCLCSRARVISGNLSARLAQPGSRFLEMTAGRGGARVLLGPGPSRIAAGAESGSGPRAAVLRSPQDPR